MSAQLAVSSPEARRCKDCGHALAPHHLYCPACGQKAVPPKLTMHELGHEFVHALLHVDRSVLSLLRMLLLRPGGVALDYVSGKRKRYIGPFAFLAVVVALGSATVEFSGFNAVWSSNPDAAAAADMLRGIMQRHVNLLFFAQVPLLAAICRAFGWRGPFNYAEYLVLIAYTSGMNILFFVLVVIPVWYVYASQPATLQHLYWVYFSLWPLYLGFALSQFLRRSLLRTVAIAILAVILTQAAISIIVSGLSAMALQFHAAHG